MVLHGSVCGFEVHFFAEVIPTPWGARCWHELLDAAKHDRLSYCTYFFCRL